MPKSVESALAPYRAKRRFNETSEPSGGAANAAGALYLIQKHDATRLHYDFRLELDGVLLSWAVTRGPSYNTKDKRLAVRTEDHPLEYGHFEGTIPEGNYGAGTVMLWDSGTWEPVGDAQEGLAQGKLAFLLHGERLHGRWALVRMRPDAKKNPRENWLLIKEHDEYANTRPNLLAENLSSVLSGRDLARIAESGTRAPGFQPPMLATLVEAPPAGEDWSFEIKYDGYRAIIAADREDVKIFTRSGLDWTAKFQGIAKAVAALQLDRALIDGEIVVMDAQGRTDFGALVAALETGKGALCCIAFDLLEEGGASLREAKLTERQARLKKLLGKIKKNAVIQFSEAFTGGGDAGEKLLKAACAHGLEGIIAKRAGSPYRGGRHGDWLKIKCGSAQEFIIIGFAPSLRGRAFASILLAVRDGETLRYAGRVGSGFSDATLARLARLRDKHRAKSSPCADVPADMAGGVTWVKPVLAAQIEFGGWTRDNRIRHGRFIGVRGDKIPAEITREAPKKMDIEITHGERLVYPDDDIHKADVAAYLARAASFMMPHIKDRFVSFLRCPEGAGGTCFFQRHPSAGFGDGWKTREFVTHKGKQESYVYCDKPDAILRAVQMGVLEFHIWGSKVGAVEKPDRLVFDLDPDEGLEFEKVKQAALRLREVLEALDLQSLPMLSGGKGIHVVAPIRPMHEWPVVKEFTGNLAARLARDAPERYVATMSKAKRRGKIFIDYFRNDIAATAIAPYSPRARKGAAVAWPLSWAALKTVARADAMDIRAADAALAAGENGWAEYGSMKQSLSAAAVKAIK